MTTASRVTRVLHVAECYEGGVGRAVDGIVAATPDLEHHLLFSGTDDSSLRGWARKQRMPDGMAARIAAVRRYAVDADVDVVHAHSSWGGLYARVAAARPVVYQPHCFFFQNPAQPGWKRAAFWAAERALAPRADAIAVVSPDEGRAARTLGHRPVVTIPNRPSVPVLVGTGVLQGRGARVPTVAMSGRISEQKDPGFFAEVARTVRRAGLPMRFLWIGGGDDAATAMLVAAGVEVTGWVDAAAMVAQLDRADLYLHSARYEGFPISVLDAAARRLPIVVRDIPSFAGTGLVRAEDARHAAQLLQEAFSDPAAADRARDAGQDLLRSMNTEEVARSAREVYRLVVRRAGAGGPRHERQPGVDPAVPAGRLVPQGAAHPAGAR